MPSPKRTARQLLNKEEIKKERITARDRAKFVAFSSALIIFK